MPAARRFGVCRWASSLCCAAVSASLYILLQCTLTLLLHLCLSFKVLFVSTALPLSPALHCSEPQTRLGTVGADSLFPRLHTCSQCELYWVIYLSIAPPSCWHLAGPKVTEKIKQRGGKDSNCSMLCYDQYGQSR